MTDPVSPFQANPPPLAKIVQSLALAAAASALILVLVILPAEYAIDPTGFGELSGLTELNSPEQTLEVSDVIGGNETIREVEIPDFGQPIPLPNPNVYRAQQSAPSSKTFSVTLNPAEQTEIKAVMMEGESIAFDWSVDPGQLYVDMHGHDSNIGDEFWVRYEEQQAGQSGAGSLIAPFSGEHGWYVLNYNSYPIEFNLHLVGYYSEIIDYGVTRDE